ASPMHDIGKIAIPDAILQKPGKLTDEEYAIMKTHADKGGKIIEETFGHSDNDEYEKMAFEVARHHHEKWNGKGYPDSLVRKDIPLCARIMAIADVFDAVSAKRCYRDAMPLEQCFEIIEKGSGTDFDPVIADVFLDMKDQVIKVYSKSRQ
ncbi:MAG: HD domain-containing protein, partial [Spirochaetia bacterium]|nr:HD domain-containing protein [Spirochaetia bacterium]